LKDDVSTSIWIEDEDEKRAFSKVLEEITEPFLSFPIISTPAIECPVLLPASTKVRPACSCTFHFAFKEEFELLLGIQNMLLFLDGRFPELPRTVATEYIKGLATCGDRG
jgi:hypothetical protein